MLALQVVEEKANAAVIPDTTVWVSLAAIPIDRGFLQTLADVTSEMRVLILYDTPGVAVRSTRLDIPPGFVAAIPARRTRIAARTMNGLELVGYRWRWSDENTLPGGRR